MFEAHGLGEILSKVKEDDLRVESERHEASQKALKALRMQAGRGLSASELLEAMTKSDDEKDLLDSVPSLHSNQEKKDAPKRSEGRFFPRPPS